MARFCSLFSSSRGNCTYIGGSGGGVLVDVGVSAKKTEEALAAIGVDPASLSAILVTHEHIDHIRGIRVFATRYNLPVFATRGTLECMAAAKELNDKFEAFVVPKGSFELAGMEIHAFRTSHDAKESCGYTLITPDSKKISVCTDLGVVTPEVKDAVSGSDLILLESNHDINMLRNGPYPYSLKRRILSDSGHLSNESCAETALKLVESGTKRLFLGHLSPENNYPPLALETTRSLLTMAGAEENRDYYLTLAPDGGEITTF